MTPETSETAEAGAAGSSATPRPEKSTGPDAGAGSNAAHGAQSDRLAPPHGPDGDLADEEIVSYRAPVLGAAWNLSVIRAALARDEASAQGGSPDL